MKAIAIALFVIFISFTGAMCISWMVLGYHNIWLPIVTLASGALSYVASQINWSKE